MPMAGRVSRLPGAVEVVGDGEWVLVVVGVVFGSADEVAGAAVVAANDGEGAGGSAGVVATGAGALTMGGGMAVAGAGLADWTVVT
jgi:hypothetical protein